ncbi:DUF7287 family protein [Natronolimnobius baerhuensis]|uniref:Uncharacterized protein n=1 Tax=Natronolimnobius baerhuensis TaxID=253108 RepID=A0A202EBG2_9EURY|nr:hypothetical protein [Natronolimnobius baerhuensis]OVE85633.1 hypothetical protein B2G88_02060 [Natronolimnobius baerhuensis]
MLRDRFDTRDENTNTDRARSATISISTPVSGDRGQTTQDFAVGIGIFILAVAFVFSFLPSIVTPYDSAVGGAETAQADRISDKVLEELIVDGGPNEIDPGLIGTGSLEDNNLADTFGLRTADDGDIRIDRLNVRIQELDNDDNEPAEAGWEFGDTYDDQPAASSARIVTVDGGEEDAYRLVVRVW